jgi:ribose 5-phosphate isomerase B
VRLAIATDHRGRELADALADALRAAGHELTDLGTRESGSVDYPAYALELARGVADGRFERGVLICGTGIGMSIAANKVPGAMAALVYDEDSLRLSREHNNANILVLPGNWLGPETARAWLERWLEIPFAGERHARRVQQILAYERERDAMNID